MLGIVLLVSRKAGWWWEGKWEGMWEGRGVYPRILGTSIVCLPTFY